MAGGYECPECHITSDESTCSLCGLWWLPPGDNWQEVPLADKPCEPATERPTVLLPEPVPAFVVAPLFFVGLGFGAAVFALLGLLQAPTSAWAWLEAVIGVGLGGWVGIYCSAWLLQLIVHAVIPGRLEGDSNGLRVRVWITWKGLWEGFRRTDVSISREHIRGVDFTTGQGGQLLLFISHESGKRFSAGWSGSLAEGTSLVQPLLHWIERHARRANCGDR